MSPHEHPNIFPVKIYILSLQVCIGVHVYVCVCVCVGVCFHTSCVLGSATELPEQQCVLDNQPQIHHFCEHTPGLREGGLPQGMVNAMSDCHPHPYPVANRSQRTMKSSPPLISVFPLKELPCRLGVTTSERSKWSSKDQVPQVQPVHLQQQATSCRVLTIYKNG